MVEGALSWHHANNTLVVSYQKPSEVVDLEIKDKAERRKMKTTKARYIQKGQHNQRSHGGKRKD